MAPRPPRFDEGENMLGLILFQFGAVVYAASWVLVARGIEAIGKAVVELPDV